MNRAVTLHLCKGGLIAQLTQNTFTVNTLSKSFEVNFLSTLNRCWKAYDQPKCFAGPNIMTLFWRSLLFTKFNPLFATAHAQLVIGEHLWRSFAVSCDACSFDWFLLRTFYLVSVYFNSKPATGMPKLLMVQML